MHLVKRPPQDLEWYAAHTGSAARRVASALVVAASVMVASPAGAQWTDGHGGSWNNPMSATLSQSVWDGINRRILLRSMLRKRGGYTEEQLQKMSEQQLLAALGGAKQAASEAAQTATTSGHGSTFKPQPTRLAVHGLAAQLTTDPQAQEGLRQLFEQGLIAFEKEAAKDGLAHDLGGATAFLLGTLWSVWHDGQEPDESGLTLAARQLQQLYDTPEMQKTPDADKQKLYELMVSLATYAGFTYGQAREANDPQRVAQAKELAKTLLGGLLKLEPSQVNITAAGLQVTR